MILCSKVKWSANITSNFCNYFNGGIVLKISHDNLIISTTIYFEKEYSCLSFVH